MIIPTGRTLVKKIILIVDDHPFIIEGYKNGITRYKPTEYQYAISQAVDCKSGYETIVNAQNNDFDIAFLDISMPPYKEKEVYSGEDLAKIVKERMPNCKIIMLTMFTELLKVENLIKTINPNGLIIKNDLDYEKLIFAFDKIMNGEYYYSESILKMIALSKQEEIPIDVIDKQILFYLAKNTPFIEIAEFANISVQAVERRIFGLKITLNNANCSDEDLVILARDKGLLF